MCAVQVEGVAHRFGESDVLNGVDLAVAPGEVLGLTGPNGAGKTTLLRVIAGLLLPREGRVRVCGDAPDRARARGWVGFCTAGEASFTRRLTLRTNLRFHAAGAGLARRCVDGRIEELASGLGFGRHLDVPADRCSTGLRQRASLARALLHRPPVVLLDEPLRGVDAASGGALVELLRRELAGRAVILVSHAPAELAALATRTVALDGGVVRGAPRLCHAA